MDKKTITFSANEQQLKRLSGIDKYATNTVSYIEAIFELGENWQGFDSVRAIWRSDYERVPTVLDSLGRCEVPSEVLRSRSDVRVNLVGSISENDVLTHRLTTYSAIALTSDEYVWIDGEDPQPITPSEYEQFVAAVHQDAERAVAGAESAEASERAAKESETKSKESETNAKESETKAKESETNAKKSEDNAKESEETALDAAERAEQSAAQSGYMFFSIDEDGYIVYERTPNVNVDFSIDEDGYICVEAIS